jgi:hypothetical protein
MNLNPRYDPASDGMWGFLSLADTEFEYLKGHGLVKSVRKTTKAVGDNREITIRIIFFANYNIS